MEKVKIFFKTSLLGGLAVILPIGILFAIFSWIFDLVARIIEPLTKIAIVQAGIREYVAGFIILTIIISACFLVGVAVKTRLGSFLHEFVEKRFLKKIPFYSIVKETIVQVIGRGKPVFISPAIFYPFGGDTHKIGFITAYPNDGHCTCFEPTAPNPTSGLIYIVPDRLVYPLSSFSTEDTMRIILSCGAGAKFPQCGELTSVAKLITEGKRP